MQIDLLSGGTRAAVKHCLHPIEDHVASLPPRPSDDNEYEILRCTICKHDNEFPWRGDRPGDAYEPPETVIPEVFKPPQTNIGEPSGPRHSTFLDRHYQTPPTIRAHGLFTWEEAKQWHETKILPESAREKIRQTLQTDTEKQTQSIEAQESKQTQTEDPAPRLPAAAQLLGEPDPKSGPEEYKHPDLDPNRISNALPF